MAAKQEEHPPYSLDLNTTDYIFVLNLNNFFFFLKKNSDMAFQTAFRELIGPHGFFSQRINELSMIWQKGLDNNVTYFD